jgi:hypothetical protein
MDDLCSLGKFDPVESHTHCLETALKDQLEIATRQVYLAISRLFCVVRAGSDAYLYDGRVQTLGFPNPNLCP